MTDRIGAFAACLLIAGGVLVRAQPTPSEPPAAPVIADGREALDALQTPPPQSPPSPRAPAPGRPAAAKTPGAPEQQPPPPPPAPLAGTPREAQRQGQPINVRVDVTITDQRGGAGPVKKTVTVVTGDGLGGLVRSSTLLPAPIGSVPLNVDVDPMILPDGKIRLRVNLQYDLPAMTPAAAQPDAGGGPAPLRTTIQETLVLILESGKPMIATQSADPVSDRQETVEVKATILR
jgi:hypothetical protein